MTSTELATLIRKKTRTNSTTYSDADLLIDVNLQKDILASRIVELRGDAFDAEDSYDTVQDQRTYAFDPLVMDSIKKVDIKFTVTGDRIVATPIQQSQLSIALQESIIVDYYDNVSNVACILKRANVFILSGSIIAVSNGLTITYKSFPVDLANMTSSTQLHTQTSATRPGFPREFNEIWARGVSIEYKVINNVKLNIKELEFENDLQRALDRYAVGNVDEHYIGSLPDTTKSNDAGYDY